MVRTVKSTFGKAERKDFLDSLRDQGLTEGASDTPGPGSYDPDANSRLGNARSADRASSAFGNESRDGSATKVTSAVSRNAAPRRARAFSCQRQNA